ncbi:hypothetical protein [Sphingomonas mollis]|uniref:Uncharacterized protein n=1 Tax=Sphingomonas mollis TaxID=2795726 RepID=A0ABS0XTL4_9SPHN|nr:hypothetical protein [Sphingomonas sp. BT553]MBJ6123388.1 hypothetical protein [Sphingomonas sp. BT553]
MMSSLALPVTGAILIDATRCWRDARDAGVAVQPCLSRTLTGHQCAMLAPVFDSLLRFYEDALGRPVTVGHAGTTTEDEQQLLGLIDGSLVRRACLNCPAGAAMGLDCAICSTRIMMALAVPGMSGTMQ